MSCGNALRDISILRRDRIDGSKCDKWVFPGGAGMYTSEKEDDLGECKISANVQKAEGII